MLLNVEAKIATLGERVKIIHKDRYTFKFMLIVIEYLLSKVSDAFGGALNAEGLDQLPCC